VREVKKEGRSGDRAESGKEREDEEENGKEKRGEGMSERGGGQRSNREAGSGIGTMRKEQKMTESGRALGSTSGRRTDLVTLQSGAGGESGDATATLGIGTASGRCPGRERARRRRVGLTLTVRQLQRVRKKTRTILSLHARHGAAERKRRAKGGRQTIRGHVTLPAAHHLPPAVIRSRRRVQPRTGESQRNPASCTSQLHLHSSLTPPLSFHNPSTLIHLYRIL
jgi:hypothetical protein